MKSIKSKYHRCEINDERIEELKIKGTTSSMTDNPGYIWVPYILQPTIILNENGLGRYWIRIIEIKKRAKKIENIRNKMNDTKGLGSTPHKE